MLDWAAFHAHASTPRARRVHIDQPMLGAPKRQRVGPMATWTLEDGRDAMAFEVRYYREHGSRGSYGQTRFLTGVALQLDPTWVRDLPQVTVSPAWETFVVGTRDIQDHRWERHALDNRFQFDAARGTDQSEVALAQLFGPQTQVALGTTCCAYWQQTGDWLMAWLPIRWADAATIDALVADARWIKSRYAELGRAEGARLAS